MKILLETLQEVLDHGRDNCDDRTGKGRRSIFSVQKRINMRDGFPIPTTRRISFDAVKGETLAFIKGVTNHEGFSALKCNFWKPWAATHENVSSVVEKYLKKLDLGEEHASSVYTELMAGRTGYPGEGDIGPMYGRMWRNWPRSRNMTPLELTRTLDELPADILTTAKEIWEKIKDEQDNQFKSFEDLAIQIYYSSHDQLNELVQNLKKDPYSSRHVVSAFNPEFLPVSGLTPGENVVIGKGSLMPCHFAFQCFVHPPEQPGGKKLLSLKWHQRSVDTFVGLPHNVPSYALLLHMLAQVTGMEAHELIFDGGDVHVYLPHIEKVKEQLTREPRPLPRLILNQEITDLFSFKIEDISLEGYDPHPKIEGVEAFV